MKQADAIETPLPKDYGGRGVVAILLGGGAKMQRRARPVSKHLRFDDRGSSSYLRASEAGSEGRSAASQSVTPRAPQSRPSGPPLQPVFPASAGSSGHLARAASNVSLLNHSQHVTQQEHRDWNTAPFADYIQSVPSTTVQYTVRNTPHKKRREKARHALLRPCPGILRATAAPRPPGGTPKSPPPAGSGPPPTAAACPG
jgi:hypothetical protein